MKTLDKILSQEKKDTLYSMFIEKEFKDYVNQAHSVSEADFSGKYREMFGKYSSEFRDWFSEKYSGSGAVEFGMKINRLIKEEDLDNYLFNDPADRSGKYSICSDMIGEVKEILDFRLKAESRPGLLDYSKKPSRYNPKSYDDVAGWFEQ